MSCRRKLERLVTDLIEECTAGLINLKDSTFIDWEQKIWLQSIHTIIKKVAEKLVDLVLRSRTGPTLTVIIFLLRVAMTGSL